MSKFAPLDLCNKLLALGCESTSEFFYIGGIIYHEDEDAYGPDGIPAFDQNDFSAATGLADKNGIAAWGNEKDISGQLTMAQYHKTQMIFCHLAYEEWFEYLERTMVKR